MFISTSTLVAFAFAGAVAGHPVALELDHEPGAGWRAATGPAPAATIWSAPPAALASGQEQQQEPIDVNKATAEDLQKIPGIGEALARRIIEFRQEHGPFEKVDDLLNVRGIGTASLDKMRPYLVVKKEG